MKVQEGNWESFEKWLSDLRSQLRPKTASRLIFRGQADSEWPLSTTLERGARQPFPILEYYRLVSSVSPAAATFTGVETPQYDHSIAEQLSKTGPESFFDPNRFPAGASYEYLIYLRHHGFPSPLLDWSKSPYVAAFFAFRDRGSGSKQRSIYIYCESLDGTRGGAVGEPTIRQLGPYVRSHPRHYRQQSIYTVCESLAQGGYWQYDSHETVFRQARLGQDVLWRFDIPSEERTDVLRRLNEFNLNAYSLFASEETLFESLWNNEYLFRK